MDLTPPSPASLEQALRPPLHEAFVEIVAKASLVAGAGIFLTCIASVTQVWQYPHPRSLLLFMAFSAGGIALFSGMALVFLAVSRAALIKHGPLALVGFRRSMFGMACLSLVVIILNWPMLRANTYALVDCGWRAQSIELCNRTFEQLRTDADRAAFEAEARQRVGMPREWLGRIYAWFER